MEVELYGFYERYLSLNVIKSKKIQLCVSNVIYLVLLCHDLDCFASFLHLVCIP